MAKLLTGWRDTAVLIFSCLLLQNAIAFYPSSPVVFPRPSVSLASSETPSSVDEPPVAFAAPLQYIGNAGFPCLTLNFPQHEAQLNFILATGSNIDMIHPAVAEKLQLPIATNFEDVPVVSTGLGGAFRAGQLFQLGDCWVGNNAHTFLADVQVAAFETNEAEGLLGTPFFLSFQHGVEFSWHADAVRPSPMVIAYVQAQDTAELPPGLASVPVTRLPASVLSIPILINSQMTDALLVTCSPITIVSPQRAEQMGIEINQGASVSGIDGRPLFQSMAPVEISVGGISLGQSHVFVGHIPGVEFLQTVGGAPDIVLGLDFLRRSKRMIIQMSSSQVLFEAMSG